MCAFFFFSFLLYFVFVLCLVSPMLHVTMVCSLSMVPFCFLYRTVSGVTNVASNYDVFIIDSPFLFSLSFI